LQEIIAQMTGDDSAIAGDDDDEEVMDA